MKKARLLLGFLAFFIPAQAHALVASDILTRARVFLKDQSTSPNRQQFPDSVLLNFLNDGQREANAIGYLLQSSYTFTLATGTTEYALPTDLMFVNQVYYQVPSGSPRKLDATSFNQLDANSASWRGTSCGTPINYYIDLSTTSVNIGFFPCPSSAGVGPVIVYYVQQTADLTSTSQTPFGGRAIMTPYESALAYYVTYRGYLALEEIELAAPFKEYWESFIGITKQGVMRQPDFNPGAGGRRTQ